MSKVVIGKASEIEQGKLTHVSAGGKDIYSKIEFLYIWLDVQRC